MIRPLEYCETSDQLVNSLDTINHRIQELTALRTDYLNKLLNITSDRQTEQGLNTTLDNNDEQ